MPGSRFSSIVLGISLFCSSGAKAVEFFEVGVNADVNTTVQLDPELMQLIENLPGSVRVEFSKAANEILNKLDKSVIDALNTAELLIDGTLRHADASIEVAINKIMNDIEALALKTSREMECTTKNVINDVFDETRSILPWYRRTGVGFFMDKCEKLVAPDEAGLSPNEKYTISECRILNVLNEETDLSIVVGKLGKLEWISKNATCLMRDTEYEHLQRKKQVEYANLSKAYIDVQGECRDITNCLETHYERISQSVGQVDSESQQKELADELEDIWVLADQGRNCLFACQRDHLLSMATIDRRAKRYVRIKKYKRARDSHESAMTDFKEIEDMLPTLKQDAKVYAKAQSVFEETLEHADSIRVVKEKYTEANETWPGFDKDLPIRFAELETMSQELNLISAKAKTTLIDIGPNKLYRDLQAGTYLTHSFWTKGGPSGSMQTWCMDGEDLSQIRGMVKFGGTTTTTWDSRRLLFSPNLNKSLGCRPQGHCDSAGEFCISYERNRGCLVSEQWLEWYQQQSRDRSVAENREHICSNKQSPWE